MPAPRDHRTRASVIVAVILALTGTIPRLFQRRILRQPYLPHAALPDAPIQQLPAGKHPLPPLSRKIPRAASGAFRPHMVVEIARHGRWGGTTQIDEEGAAGQLQRSFAAEMTLTPIGRFGLRSVRPFRGWRRWRTCFGTRTPNGL